ncbi:hypothetical protein BU17DRAFT_67217 [Hysterangium stoloniferum]|nr:hypothetical protein BU17DRAFT_67217 [Hysterangium stoloniferum]
MCNTYFITDDQFEKCYVVAAVLFVRDAESSAVQSDSQHAAYTPHHNKTCFICGQSGERPSSQIQRVVKNLGIWHMHVHNRSFAVYVIKLVTWFVVSCRVGFIQSLTSNVWKAKDCADALCYRCGQKGHTASACSSNKCPFDSDTTYISRLFKGRIMLMIENDRAGSVMGLTRNIYNEVPFQK